MHVWALKEVVTSKGVVGPASGSAPGVVAGVAVGTTSVFCLGVESCVTVVDVTNDVRDVVVDVHEKGGSAANDCSSGSCFMADVMIDESCVKTDSVCECTD